MRNERDIKGIWIPIEIWEDTNLSVFETALLAEIDSLDCGEGCYKSDEELAKRMRCSVSHLGNTLTSLRKRKYLRTIESGKHRRHLRTYFSRYRKKLKPDLRPTEKSRSHLLRKVGDISSTMISEDTLWRKGSATARGIFPLNGEVSPFIRKCSERLETYIRVSRKISPSFRRQKWYDEFRLLLQQVDGDGGRIKRALKAFINLPNEKYKPQVECAESFRKKFLRIENWIKEYHQQNGDPEPPEEDNDNDGPIITSRRVYA